MDWTNETVMRFLELYQKHPCIWDPKNPYHKVKFRLNNAWIDIKNNLGEPYTVKELKKKKQSLMSAYRGYRTKIKKSEISGLSLYKPAWFAYSFMDSFLRPVYKCKLLTAVEDDENQDDAEQSDAYNEPDIYEILDDKGDTNTTGETDASNTDNETLSPASMYYGTTNQVFLQEITPKKKLHDPADLQQAKDHIDQAFNILKSVSQQHETEDECDIFGKLIAKKMRRLPEDCRDLMMVKINTLFYEESREQSRRSSSSSMNLAII